MRIDDESHGEASIYHRITLEKGEQYQDAKHERTDEGHSSEYTEYTFDRETLILERSTDSRDCDGRQSTSHTLTCPASYVEKRQPNPDGIRLPEWWLEDSSQRDYEAEKAGY